MKKEQGQCLSLPFSSQERQMPNESLVTSMKLMCVCQPRDCFVIILGQIFYFFFTGWRWGEKMFTNFFVCRAVLFCFERRPSRPRRSLGDRLSRSRSKANHALSNSALPSVIDLFYLRVANKKKPIWCKSRETDERETKRVLRNFFFPLPHQPEFPTPLRVAYFLSDI